MELRSGEDINLFIIIEHLDVTSERFLGCFSTQEKAENFVTELKEHGLNVNDIVIYKFPIDKPFDFKHGKTYERIKEWVKTTVSK